MKKLVITLFAILAALAATLYLSPASLTIGARLVEQHLAGLSGRRTVVGDLSIHYYEGGPAKGETVLMIHGFAANKDNWLRFARHLTPRYHVIALDLPGFGDSDRPAGSYDVGTQAERVASFIDALELGRVHLVGNSMGGHIAALIAARHPRYVRSLALFNNSGINAPRESELFRLLEQGQANPLVVRRTQDFQRMLEFVFVEPPSLPAQVKTYLAQQSMANEAHYDEVFRQLRERYIPLEPELPRIEAPALLLWCDRDRVLDVSSIEVMKPLLRKPTVVIMENCGHAPMIERPEETARQYQAFIEHSAD